MIVQKQKQVIKKNNKRLTPILFLLFLFPCYFFLFSYLFFFFCPICALFSLPLNIFFCFYIYFFLCLIYAFSPYLCYSFFFFCHICAPFSSPFVFFSFCSSVILPRDSFRLISIISFSSSVLLSRISFRLLLIFSFFLSSLSIWLCFAISIRLVCSEIEILGSTIRPELSISYSTSNLYALDWFSIASCSSGVSVAL